MHAIKLKWRALPMNQCDECGCSTKFALSRCTYCGNLVCNSCIKYDKIMDTYSCTTCLNRIRVDSTSHTYERRIAAINFSPEALMTLIANGTRSITVDSRLPIDAKFMGAWYDTEKASFLCHFEHPSFDPVLPGCFLPNLGDIWIALNDNPSV